MQTSELALTGSCGSREASDVLWIEEPSVCDLCEGAGLGVADGIGSLKMQRRWKLRDGRR